MSEFALFIKGQFQAIETHPARPVDIPHKAVAFYPVRREYGTPGAGIEGDAYVIRTVDPATLPPVVPRFVTPRQARLALLAVGKLDAANTAVSQSDEATRVAWEFSSVVVRDDPGVIAMAKAIGLSPADVDALFIAADAL